MSIVVYYRKGSGYPQAEDFVDADFMDAMRRMEVLRKEGYSHVAMSTELAGAVGKPGVNSIVDGKTPDGIDYEWSKAGRAGKMKKKDLEKIHTSDH